MSRSAAPRAGPGGVDDGLPTLPDGEPVLHRWFVITLLVLVVAAVAVGAFAWLSISEPTIDPAARRPPGSTAVTHERGDAVLNRVQTAEPGPDCAAGITMVGDAPARATTARALEAVCPLLGREEFAVAREGLARWQRADGVVRIAVFELTGVDSSARLDDSGDAELLVVELNAKFQFEPAERAAPAVVHELVHFARGMPGAAVTAGAELEAVRAQAAACGIMSFDAEAPRGCRDARALLDADDPLAQLVAAGYPAEDPSTSQEAP